MRGCPDLSSCMSSPALLPYIQFQSIRLSDFINTEGTSWKRSSTPCSQKCSPYLNRTSSNVWLQHSNMLLVSNSFQNRPKPPRPLSYRQRGRRLLQENPEVLRGHASSHPCCLDKPIPQIESDDLRQYLNDYESARRTSKVTIDSIRRNMSSFFSWLEDEDYIGAPHPPRKDRPNGKGNPEHRGTRDSA